jgi:hypothetical protein
MTEKRRVLHRRETRKDGGIREDSQRKETFLKLRFTE